MAGEYQLREAPAQPTFLIDPTTRLPTSGGGGGGGGGAVTVADGADVNAGALADAAATAGGTGSISAKLRAISRDIVANIVLKAGTAIIGKVGIDQTTPGTTNGVQILATVLTSIMGKDGSTIMSDSNPAPSEQAALSDVDKPLVAGTVAHDAADSGNPVKIGGKARTTNPTAVADADRVDGAFDKLGRQLVVIGQARELRANQTTTLTSTTTETTILTAGAAGVFHDLTHLLITNKSATDVSVDIRDDTAGSIVATIGVKAGMTGGFTGAVAYNQTTAAKPWTAQCSASVASVIITVQAHKNL